MVHISENDFFREMTLRICSSLDIEKALKRAFDFLKSVIPVDTMGLGYHNLADDIEKQPSIYILAKVARKGTHYIWKDDADKLLLPKEAAEYLRSVTQNVPITQTFNQPEEQHPSMRTVFTGIKSNSAIFLQLEVHGGRVGVLLISVKGHGRYTEEYVGLLKTIRKPFTIAMANARRYKQLLEKQHLLKEDNRALSAEIKRSLGEEVVGADFGLYQVMEQVRQVAQSNSPVLLLGETGTGKEVIANAIHMASNRNKGPLISIQCGAIPYTLLDSELFGHEKGAFTGASEQKRGRFERAQGGTLFFDEIGELSAEAQVKLLRVLQEKKFERIGGNKTIESDARIIAATHRDLDKMVKEGRFREDLWYRLNVLPIHIPPLRLRREDISSLVHYFVERKTREMNLMYIPNINSKEMERLKAYDWPGNVRELQNLVERALILSKGGNLVFPEMHSSTQFSELSTKTLTTTTAMTLDEVMVTHIKSVLHLVDWQVAGPGGAAEILNINPSTLRFRIKKLGIKK